MSPLARPYPMAQGTVNVGAHDCVEPSHTMGSPASFVAGPGPSSYQENHRPGGSVPCVVYTAAATPSDRLAAGWRGRNARAATASVQQPLTNATSANPTSAAWLPMRTNSLTSLQPGSGLT